ncbi:MAG TPA: hypothetical protein DEB46_01225 [Myxococcales bacterium]|nr:hypothetical protein [Myxococcales bacterium]
MNDLTMVSLTQQLQRLRPEERVDWLANHPQAAAFVPQLSPLVLHRLAHDLGGQELAPLLPFCSDDQMRSLVDLSAWEQHDFQSEAFEGWLMLNLQGGGRQLDRFLAALDPEQYLLYLVGRVRVHEIDEDERYPTLANAVPGDALWFSPDRRFCVEILHWEKQRDDEGIRSLLHHLEGRNAWELSRLLAALAWELEGPLSEESTRLRRARLEELGFPPLDEAQALYAPASLEFLVASRRREPLSKAPDEAGLALLGRPGPQDLLRHGLEAMVPEAAQMLRSELIYLANRALVADACDPGDQEALHTQTRRVRATVTLGLEFLARKQGGDLTMAAAQVMERYAAATLFRLGVNLVRPLVEMARRLRQDPRSGPDSEALWLGATARGLMDQLLQPRPLAPNGEPIADLATMTKMGQTLEATLSLIVSVFPEPSGVQELYNAEFEGSTFSRPEEMSLEGIARTKEALELLGDRGGLRPLRVSELQALREKAPSDEALGLLLSGPLEPRFLYPLWCELEA